jgi:O-antigen/teichoic acid export membrane protein
MRRRLPDLLIIALLFFLPLVMFWAQTVGGRTLLPTENIYQYEPYATYREEAGAPAIPHNHLLSDLVLQNYPFKLFIRQQLASGEFPLWNPHQFSGIPFFAAGQQSTLYPFSALFYLLDLPAAYGWFIVVQLWLAGVFMLALARGLGIGRFGATIAGITYQLSAFFVISAVFPMIVAGAVWLPLLLLMTEFIIRRQATLRGQSGTLLWVAIGALALGCNVLAGHVEITYYTLLITAFYAAARLLTGVFAGTPNGVSTPTTISELPSPPSHPTTLLEPRHARATSGRGGGGEGIRAAIGRGLWLVVMVALGLALGAVQFIPIFEAASASFRVGSATLDEVYGWAHPMRDLLQFVMPNFYGNPAHHTIYNWATGETLPITVNALGEAITHSEWGIKNYVEGALYVGILPLVLAIYAGVDALWQFIRRFVPSVQSAPPLPPMPQPPPYRGIFAVLGLLSLSFMFGLPTYALLYYALPGINQLHSPFRWVFALTLCVAVLAGFGAERWARRDTQRGVLALNLSSILFGLGALALAGLLLSRLFYAQVLPLVERAFTALAGAERAFPNAEAFYHYQFTNVLIMGLVLVGAGVGLWMVQGRNILRPYGQMFVLALVAADLMIASWGFNPASDPALLTYTPPAIEWLREREGEWRFTTLEMPGRPAIMNANLGMYAGLQDVRGYESIIPSRYVDFMETFSPQNQLPFNRVAPFRVSDGYDFVLEADAVDALNIRYVMTYADDQVSALGWTLAYEDAAVRIYENAEAYGAQLSGGTADVTMTRVSARELLYDVQIAAPQSELILSQNYNTGWRAFIRPQGADEAAETPLTPFVVDGNFIRLRLAERGAWTVRLVYSPTSFQIGAFASFIGGALVLLLAGAWLWRGFVQSPVDAGGTAARVAKNSIAPILLNLFNRGIDFAFAAVMLRLLGPEQNGLYYYAIILFGWFDIFTNFGLNLFVMREVARDRSAARSLFINTSALRLLLALLGVPLLIAFLVVRQSTGGDPLPAVAIVSIVLLYIGLIPNSLSTGLTALFYAFERAEVPAAVATVATIAKAVLGLAALLAGWGIVGLAGASIFTNIVTLAILAWSARDLTPDPSPSRREASEADTALNGGEGRRSAQKGLLDVPLIRSMVGQSYPLMLNHFLATIFFKIDVILIEAIHTATMVGQYSVAYKWVEALNIIPSFFTQALLPVMSRQAHDDRPAFTRTYQMALKLLVALALPVAIVMTFLAVTLVNLLGGAEYLPDGAIALQLMIWSIPIGWMNSLTQYALIALDMQQRITRAFIAGVGFNIVTNLIFIPTYGYQAAAITTILSEAVLFIGFVYLLRQGGVVLNWLAVLGRPLLAGGAMLAVLLLGWSWSPLATLLAAGVTYVGVLAVLRPFTAEEWARLGRGKVRNTG